jgi:hypothetical protein
MPPFFGYRHRHLAIIEHGSNDIEPNRVGFLWQADGRRAASDRDAQSRLYPSICVSPQIEIACPEIVRPRGLHMNRIWSAICSGVT